jgi:hypothetical protein
MPLDESKLNAIEIVGMPSVFKYYHPNSITINNNTSSDNFGNIYITSVENINIPGDSVSRDKN